MAANRMTDPWEALRRFTSARIGLGRTGASLPTPEVLRFGLAHAAARDAVHLPLDVAALERSLPPTHGPALVVHSRAPDRPTYLLRPDLGRRLDELSAARIAAVAPPAGIYDLVVVMADGLSPLAVQRHAPAVLDALRATLPESWRIAPPVLALQGRVALGDEVGELLGARMVLMLIGERPGLGSPDSLGAYLTWAPRVGRSDAERNCVSNIRPDGLDPLLAAKRIAWLLGESRRLQLSGVALKDRSDLLA